MSFCLEFLLGASVLFAIWLMAQGWEGTKIVLATVMSGIAGVAGALGGFWLLAQLV